ncbi:3-dehydroquinate synthase [Aurantimonas sp. C2-6-R+9]|uniref:3-dehydroquinate synthase n=1 Tax=unclassified Aurantimonas TaxID=2638230 RepID=UPI002E181CB4|nr:MULTISPECIES: 3-dehydroquinate synthase [unclassified Aurantimonas]MEC5292276.1 3-dehydroquinate synthase [Aurantimonas sp. C2-3-R2]MEC5382491.1 3-dehydroquinate synthase [Aurantimonas sp. C2-6-R+9]MEC5413361.1 3-dehydroquinate synthase [Aurantimonas sp. C2-4-R8]
MTTKPGEVPAGLAAQAHWQRFSVPFEYPVAFTRDLFGRHNRVLREALCLREPTKRHRCLVFLDSGVSAAVPTMEAEIAAYAEAHADGMILVAPPIIVPGGEVVKTELTHIEAVQDAIHAHAIDRHSYVIAIGGGAFLDAVGLAAATAHRGVRHIRVPTTVLAQNDSGVGVKNAVNLKGLKNYIGTFAPPWAVLNDFDVLKHLPQRERVAGISEAVKVALIRDRVFFEWLEANVDALATFTATEEEHMIRRSAELHMHQIAHGGDPFEAGSARPLDFGHWSAHKLEGLTRHRVRHGEAVAIGIALDARYSVLAGLLEPGAEERIAVLLEGLGLRVWHSALARKTADGTRAILAGLEEFREHLGGALSVTLLQGIGVGVEVDRIDPRLVEAALDWLAMREAG